MSESLSALDPLRQQLEGMAKRLVLTSDDAESLLGLVGEMESFARAAAGRAHPNLASIAEEIAGLVRLSSSPAGVLSEGLVRLQQVVQQAPERDAVVRGESAQPAPSKNRGLEELAEDPELISDFVLESREHLESIEAQLLVLDKDPLDMEAIHATFRSFHTIKGLAGFLGLDKVKEVAHEVETLLDLARESKLSINPEITDVILASKDYLGQWVNHLEGGKIGGAPERLSHNQQLIRQIEGCMGRKQATEIDVQAAGHKVQEAPQVDTFRSPAPPAAAAQPPTPAAPGETARKSKASSVKVDTAKLDFLVDMVGEMVIAQSMISYDPSLQANTNPQLARNLNQLGRITNEVQRTAMAMRMVEIGPLFQKMNRLVRDLTRKIGKVAEFETEGDHVQVDRQIVEDLADPLMHMVRNSVDHGIETPASRIAAGKDPTARVRLRAMHHSGQIVIQISDDGRGLNKEKILAKARANGLITASASLTEGEIYNLIFAPGFSTAEVVSDVSGRGVGMDVVKKQIQKLRGSVDIQSIPGKGATFSLKLPLTLAIIDGLLIGVGGERYIIPIYSVRELFRPKAEMFSQVDSSAEVVLVRDNLFPLVRLHERFHIEPRARKPEDGVLVVSEVNGRVFAMLVDEVIGKQEVVIKTLGPTFRRIAGIAGGAILGDGNVGLILDMQGVFGGATD
jgi:two-component system chemotaxis sensor kinase CheA